MTEIIVGKFYEKEFSSGDWWMVTPIKVTKRTVYFKDLQKFDKEVHNCTLQYFKEQFVEMRNEK